MRISVLKDNPDVLVASLDPDQSLAEAVLLFSLAFAVAFVIMGQYPFALLCSSGLLLSVVALATEHRLVCRLDRKNDVLIWSEGGYIGKRLFRIDKERKVTEVVRVEMAACGGRGPARFRIRLELASGELIPLTLCTLRFSECVVKAGEVTTFLGLSEAPRVNDGPRVRWV